MALPVVSKATVAKLKAENLRKFARKDERQLRFARFAIDLNDIRICSVQWTFGFFMMHVCAVSASWWLDLTKRPWRCLDTCTDNPVSKRCHYMTETYFEAGF